MIMMDAWTFLWLIVCLTIFITILESIHRRLRQRQLRQEELELQRQIQAQQYHVFSLERITVPSGVSRARSVPTLAEQQFIHEQQELRAAKDLPPKYEDVVNCPSISIPIGSSGSVSHIPLQQERY